MKIFLVFAFTLLGLTVSSAVIAQAPEPVFSKVYVDSVKKAHGDSVKSYRDSLARMMKATTGQTSTGKSYGPQEIAELTVVVALFLIMILLFYKFFRHLKDHNQRIGYQSIKLIGLILIFPGICILALIGGEKILSGQTLAVLLGTIAGYVLSREEENKQEISDAKMKAYEDTIKALKEGRQTPGT